MRTEKSHQHTAWQRFLPTGPLAFLPLPDGRSSIVWSVVHAEAARLRSLDAAGFGAALTAASGEFLGSCKLTTPVASFPLKLQYAVDYVRPRACWWAMPHTPFTRWRGRDSTWGSWIAQRWWMS